MSYVDKAMSGRSPSPNIKIPEITCPSGAMSVTSSIEPTPLPAVQGENLHGPVAILWDIENCPVPSDVRPEDVAGNIRLALRAHPLIKGAVTMFSAYGDFNSFPRRLREGCQRTGVKLVDVPNGRKDAAHKAILVDTFLLALDNHPPSSIMLISGDVDFAPALHILGQRGYMVILVIPSKVFVSSALCSAGRYVWDWSCIAHGEGFVSSRTGLTRGSELSGYLMGNNFDDCHDVQIEEEAIVYKGSYNSSNTRDLSVVSQTSSEYNINYSMPAAFLSSSKFQGQPSRMNEASSRDQSCRAQASWVQPGDIQGLKGQLVKLLETSGGSLPLVRVPSEYLRSYGRPLYMSEYGVFKLVHLVEKMADTLSLVGRGHKKFLCLRSSDRYVKKFDNIPIILKRNKNDKGVVGESSDIGISPNTGSSSDDSSDEERNADAGCEYDGLLEGFRREIQEILVCYSCPVPLDCFEVLYQQRYKKIVDYQKFGSEGLEELVEKVRDVVKLCEDQWSKKKFLISSIQISSNPSAIEKDQRFEENKTKNRHP
ncbi:uncharacterized protein LOC110031969 isoform X2 [Phalaenopsis equestris]|uniref:uncharacterized protein LOC110031969 isoform X2 n=1 Tax=Phalaenopsis equestris TaxID=78828 RepID=UPI0009E410A6|nr:uncharacterized protein LOC110031969 isoform X2 [Phalaenopsis equestris]